LSSHHVAFYRSAFFSCYRSSCRFIVALLCYRHRISRNSRLLHLFSLRIDPQPRPMKITRGRLCRPIHTTLNGVLPRRAYLVSSVPKAPISAVSTCAITLDSSAARSVSRLKLSGNTSGPSSPWGSSGEEILNKQIRSNITKQNPPTIRPLWAVSRAVGSSQNLLVFSCSSTPYRIVKTNSPPFPTPFAVRSLCSRIRILPCICIDRSRPIRINSSTQPHFTPLISFDHSTA
jgi:hypothetical protein